MTGGPILIGGLSGSGKTQLRLALEVHPALSLTRRTAMWTRFHGRFGDLRRPRNLERCLAAMTADARVRRLSPDPDRIRREFRDGPASYARLFGLFHQHHAERRGARRWGDQLQSVERFADPIFASFPDARMIHMIREPYPRATAARRTARHRGGLAWETARWLESARLAERNRRRHPHGYRVIRYETLAADPVRNVTEACAFLGEDYLPAMGEVLATLTFDQRTAGQETATAEAAFLARSAGRYLTAFDYPVAPAALPPAKALSFMVVDWPLGRSAMAARWVLQRAPLTTRARS